MVNLNDIKEFLDKKNIIAIVGVSPDTKKWGFRIYRALKSSGFGVYPVNPKYKNIGDDTCYPGIDTVPRKPDLVITVVPPKITDVVVKECRDLGIQRVWMQPGSESKKAIDFCSDNNIQEVHGVCFVVDGLKQRFSD